MSLTAGLKGSRIQSPEKVAIAYGEQSWTYAEFDDITDTIAMNLLAAGLERGDRVAVHLLNGPEFAFASFGCLKAGCIAVPINTRLKGREIDYILRHSGSACYVGQSELYSEVSGACPALKAMELLYVTGEVRSGRIRTFDDLLRPALRPVSLSEIMPDQLAAVLYTSGTTARPKGVVHSHRTLTQMAHARRYLGLDQDQVVLIMFSMAHVVGFAALFLSALVNGATIVITRPFDFSAALEAHARWLVTYTIGLPVLFEGLLAAQIANPHDVSSGRFYFCAGDSVSPALQKAFRATFAPMCEAYGATEAVPVCWNRPGQIRVGSLGTPAEDVAMRLLDSENRDVKPGEVGEICVRAKHLMTGYWQDPDATAAAMRDGWFHTGDLARCDADGYYWFAGRKKEIIIRGGSNISPQEVEAVLYEHPAVSEAAVVGRPDAVWGEVVVAHIVLRQGHVLNERDLIAFARERIADYKTPEAVVFHSELPKSATGKIQRRALREMQQAVSQEA
jgi:long-chain acyl-CoA synthetase